MRTRPSAARKSDVFAGTGGVKRLVLSVVFLVVLSAGAACEAEFETLEEELAGQIITVADPIEPWNRLMYHVNDRLYFWVLKPCAEGYKAVVPEAGRIGIRNFFHNLAMPVRLVSCLLQGKGDSAGREFCRFVINTTVGILGFGDPAGDKWKLESADEDLGQTLSVYGLGNGFYIVWPLSGPSTLRDSVGMAGDFFLNPVHYARPAETSIGLSAANVINKTSLRIGEYEDFKSAAIDPYVAMRQVYIQYRTKQIKE